MSNSKLVSYTKISPNSSTRTAKISKITIHHMAGNLSVESCGEVFQNTSRQASSNYGVGTDGRIGLYVDESRRAWTSSNRDNDNVAVTIEVANDGGAPDWHVSDRALASTINLCVDICERNGIPNLNFTGDKSGNLTMHKWFTNTQCPGPYLGSKFQHIAEEVNKRLGTVPPVSAPVVPNVPSNTVYRVQVGAYSSKTWATKKRDTLVAAGFDVIIAVVDGTLFRVQVGAFSNMTEANSELARLKAAGHTGYVTTLSGIVEPDEAIEATTDKKSDDRIAQEVAWGLWGNGAERVNRLTAAGYDYNVIQTKVNKLLNK